MNTAVQGILKAAVALAGGSILGWTLISDQPIAERIRKNIGSITSSAIDATAKDIINAAKKEASAATAQSSGLNWVDAATFSGMSTWARDDYVEMMRQRQDHELALKRLEIERLRLENALKAEGTTSENTDAKTDIS